MNGQEVIENSLDMWRLDWFSPGYRMNTTIGIDLAVDSITGGNAGGRTEVSTHDPVENRFGIRSTGKALHH